MQKYDTNFIPPDVSTKEAFEELLQSNASKGCLDVCEIYQGWCGPSIASLSTFRKLLLKHEGKKLRFFTVNAALIDCPKRSDYDALPRPRCPVLISARAAGLLCARLPKCGARLRTGESILISSRGGVIKQLARNF